MPDSTALSAFVAAALVVLLIPGPGVLYVVTHSLAQGRRAGLVSVLGLSAGALVHVAAAATGLSLVLLASAHAFTVVKTLGACYLVYLGIRMLLAKPSRGSETARTRQSLRRLFVDGILVSVLNPKIAIFFLAFLPQFIEPSRGAIPLQLLSLGLVYVALALCTDSIYAITASGARRFLGSRLMRGPLPQYVSGSVFLGLGLSLALSERRA